MLLYRAIRLHWTHRFSDVGAFMDSEVYSLGNGAPRTAGFSSVFATAGIAVWALVTGLADIAVAFAASRAGRLAAVPIFALQVGAFWCLSSVALVVRFG